MVSNIIQSSYGAKAYGAAVKVSEVKQNGAQAGTLTTAQTKTQANSFLNMAAQAGGDSADVPEISRRTEVTYETPVSNVDAYMEHLKRKYVRVIIESIGKDQASLEAAGKRMSGNDIVIAPNILEDMAGDPEKAAYYERKIDYFFTDVIPKGKAYAASIGLTFEPCGVVIHEDGTVTYICGGGDSPERVAEVNRINAEKARKKAGRQRQYQEQAVAAASQRRTMWQSTAETAEIEAMGVTEKTFFNIGDLLKTRMLKTRMVSAPAITAEVPLPAGTNMFFLNI